MVRTALIVSVLAASLVPVTEPGHGAPPQPAGGVHPAPQQVDDRDNGFPVTPVVGLVRAADADRFAEQSVRETLRGAGVTQVVTTDGTDPGTPVTVWLGDGDAVLAQLRVAGADRLPTEGYVLAAGRDAQDRGHVVLDGVDRDGTFYAAQTLRQLVQPRAGRDWMPGVEVRDWPAMPYRGLIEGFYGTPWSHQDRLALIDHLGAHKMNTFEYAPKDDPYHRERWREPYPPEKLAELGELVDRSAANHVDFTFALSPGLSICYTSEADFRALVSKFEALYRLGARAFNIPLDDINYNVWHCDADRQRFGGGGGAAGRAQAHLLNRVQREWVEPKGDVAPLQMVPTEYYNVSESPYKRALREEMDGDVVVMWTGIGVIPKTITVAEAERAREVFGHEILVWDNYPVNDYIAGRLPLAPYTGRENGLSEPLVGIVSNPMNQAAASEIALSSFGDFGWNDRAYDPVESWQAATLEMAGGDRRVAEALRTFADLNWFDSTLHDVQSPLLAADVADFWKAWNQGDHATAVADLRRVLDRHRRAADTVRTGVPDPRFLAETDAWLRAASHWLAAGEAALDLLRAQAAGEGAAAWQARQRAEQQIRAAKEIRPDKAPHSGTHPRVGDGVLDRFVTDAFAVHADLVGVRQSRSAPFSSMGVYADNELARMVDGDPATFYWSNRAPRAGDAFGVDLGAAYQIGVVEVLMAKPTSPNDYVHNGVLEWSRDGETWHTLSPATQQEVRATAPAGATARYLRVRALDGNSGYWIVAREFTVEITDPDFIRYSVTGGPPPAAGSTLGAAADGSLDTTYAAAQAPAAGESLVVTASAARPVDRIVVLQRGDEPAGAVVELRRADGAWVAVGRLGGGYTELAAGAVTADAARLRWEPGGPPPQIAEIVLAER